MPGNLGIRNPASGFGADGGAVTALKLRPMDASADVDAVMVKICRPKSDRFLCVRSKL